MFSDINRRYTCTYKDIFICRQVISNSFVISLMFKISDKGKLLIVIPSKEVAVLSGRKVNKCDLCNGKYSLSCYSVFVTQSWSHFLFFLLLYIHSEVLVAPPMRKYRLGSHTQLQHFKITSCFYFLNVTWTALLSHIDFLLIF